jgi:hypothetical protein
MPSFYEAMKRIIQGKPVYDASNEPSNPPEQPLDEGPQPAFMNDAGSAVVPEESTEIEHEQSPILKSDSRTFPVLYIRKTVTKFNGSEMQIYCFIQNNFSETIDVHKIGLMGKEEELKRPLRPNEEHEFLVYEGPQPESPNEHQALLVYKTETGDYFEAIHDIKFKFNYVAKTYYVDEINLRLPIRDIYG